MEQQHIHVDVRFSIIPEWLLDSEVSDKALRVYAILARYADNETLQAFPSRETIAERARCHVKTVDRALEELIGLRAITKKHRKSGNGFSSNIYTVKRVGTKMSPGRDTSVATVGTPVSLDRDMDVALTRTNELEPKELEPLTRTKPKDADDYEPSHKLLDELAATFPQVRLDVELQKFRDHHMARGSRFSLWDRAFRKWITQASEWNKPGGARPERLTNNQKAALLAHKYRQEAQEKEIEAVGNPKQAKAIEAELSTWFKGVDDV